VDVVRHPYSFRGGAPKDEMMMTKTTDATNDPHGLETWTWHNGLNTYAGDDLEQALFQSGLYQDDIKDLRSPGGLQRALNKPNHSLLKTLERVSVIKGYNLVWTPDNLRKAIQTMNADDLGSGHPARGKRVGSEVDVLAGNEFRQMLQDIASDAAIQFEYNVNFQWYPIDSQRVLLYARQFGAAEAYSDALARRHFTKGLPSGSRNTVLDATKEVGLDVDLVEEMLNGEDFKQQVLQSYHDTIAKHRIHSIPNFTFNGPKTNGGKFRPNGVHSGEVTISGSGSVGQFLSVFEHIRDEQLET